MTALMYASMFPDSTDIVKRLLEKGADAKLTDFSGKTALSMAREQVAPRTVALLEQWTNGQTKTWTQRPKPAERTKPKRYKF